MEQKKSGFFNKFLNFVEVGGNKLPHPVTLFAIFSLVIIALSGIFSLIGSTVTYTRAGQEVTISAKSLMNAEGIRYMINSMVKNFTSFAPLGTVLVALLGVGVCEGTGLMSAVIRKVVLATPRKSITAMVVFAGIMSNVASDAGYVVLTPLGAIIFLSFGRHPLAGIAAAFAGVSGGFSANLLVGTIDPLLSGLSTEAAKLLNPDYVVSPTSNWYFLAISTFVITILGTLVTEKIVEPRLGKYTGSVEVDFDDLKENEKKGLRWAGISFAIFIGIMLFMTLPTNGILRENGSLIPWTNKGLVPTLMFFFLIPGVAYGMGAKTIKSDKDVANLMGDAMSSMGGYLALAFAASQFIAYFSYTNLGTILAVRGADGLQSIGLTGFPLIIAFIILTGFINLFMGSASAKWAIMAPVFIPMLMRLGLSPEFTQVAYRIGDSTTNIISPLMSYFAVIVAFAQKYDKKTGMGTLISTMLPYSLIFMLGWTVLLLGWYFLGLPLGPGAGLFYTA
ncbi:MAG: AbgT family transporter [Fusobacteriaceae bacterium]